jgi:hypothetical protein
LGKSTHCQGSILGSGHSRKQARTRPFLFFCEIKSSSREKVDWEPVCVGSCWVVALESSSSYNANQLDNGPEPLHIWIQISTIHRNLGGVGTHKGKVLSRFLRFFLSGFLVHSLLLRRLYRQRSLHSPLAKTHLRIVPSFLNHDIEVGLLGFLVCTDSQHINYSLNSCYSR